MKHFIISFLFSTLLFGNICLANNTNIPQTVLSSFKTRFHDAQSISWTDSKDYYKVWFSSNGQTYCAFYSHDEDFVAVTRQLDVTQLPLLLQHKLQKKYEKFAVCALLEVQQDDTISYYAELENDKTDLVIKSGLDGEWREFLRAKRK
ncbi:MAG: hypothetical protein ACJ749_07675 [Flavisolibacter sp.]